ncbi:DNA-binding protein [Lachnotalea glycerini]|nr:DNA-binding protein [Lachnotalea glycerini]
MEKIVEQALLYDFYGELLNNHQKQIYEDFVLNDFSLSEIAQEQGISRQGVHDLIKRCNHILAGYEEKLHLIDKFLSAEEKINRINELSKQFEKTSQNDIVEEIQKISNQILEEF